MGWPFATGTGTVRRLRRQLSTLRAEWERDLRPPLPQFVLYQVEREQVEALLE